MALCVDEKSQPKPCAPSRQTHLVIGNHAACHYPKVCAWLARLTLERKQLVDKISQFAEHHNAAALFILNVWQVGAFYPQNCSE